MASIFAAQESSTTSSFMLPGMSSPEVDADSFIASRVVRFDNECVLIPEVMQKRQSLMVTKSYSLPLWRRKANSQLSDSDIEDATGAVSSSPDDSRVVIKVPIPLFRRKSSRSPTRGRSVSLSPVISKRPPSCLVDRSTSPIAAPLSPVRRPSLPIYQRRKDETTVPLRACCEACESATEESLKEGENWHEKFSRGAKRRRSGSLDNHDINGLFKAHTHVKQSSFSKEFSALSASLDNMAESSRYGGSSAFALTVDEVDKRRKSLDINREPLEPFFASPPSPIGPSFSISSASSQSPGSLRPGTQRYPRSLGREHDMSSSAISASPTMEDLMPDILDHRHRLRSSPIEEEDEAQLFPLPSPRRSPSGTPSPRLSPIPSPRASSSSLVPSGTGRNTLPGRSVSASSSRESVASNSKLNTSQESFLRASFSRKQASPLPNASTNSLPRSPSPLAVSARAVEPVVDIQPVKKLSLHGLKISTAPTASARAASDPISPKGPRPPSFMKPASGPEQALATKATSTPPLPSLSPPQAPGVEPEPTVLLQPEPLQSHIPLIPLRLSTVTNPVSVSSPIPIPQARDSTNTHTKQPSTSSQHSSLPHSNIQTHPYTAHTHGHSSSTSSSNSGGMSPVQRRKHSFSLPFIRAGEALRDAGADMLKGVSSISGPGVV